MASHPPGECCGRGFKHEGVATGEIKKIGQYDTYFAYPPNNPKPEHAVLIIPDVIGIYPNSQFLADDFAANGYLTIIPDIFRGDAFNPAKEQLMEWLPRHSVDDVERVVDAAISYLRNEAGVKKIGAVGYCFGGKYVCRYLKDKRVDAGFTAHPSFVTAEELAAISGPLSIAAAETDSIFPAEKRRESEDILIGTKQPYQVTLYSGVEHGFAVRGDLSVRQNRFAKEQAFVQAVTWFKHHL